jgi:hypothetical protein
MADKPHGSSSQQKQRDKQETTLGSHRGCKEASQIQAEDRRPPRDKKIPEKL